MTQKELLQIITDYMLENNIGYMTFTASTNFDKTHVVFNIEEEDEDDIQDYGYNTNFTC